MSHNVYATLLLKSIIYLAKGRVKLSPMTNEKIPHLTA